MAAKLLATDEEKELAKLTARAKVIMKKGDSSNLGGVTVKIKKGQTLFVSLRDGLNEIVEALRANDQKSQQQAVTA